MGKSNVKGAKKQTAPLPISGTHIVYGSGTATGRGFASCAATVIAASVAGAVARYGPSALQRADEATLLGMPVSELVAVIRRKNRLVGATIEIGWRLAYLGECRRSKREPADVYLFFGGKEDEVGFVSTCRQVYTEDPRRVVMLVASQVRLSAKHLLLLKGRGMSTIRLTARHAEQGWVVHWDQYLEREGAARAWRVGKRRPAAYCRVITRGGTRTMKRGAYNKLLKRRGAYDMFVDGVTREASCRVGRSRPVVKTLGPMELDMLVDMVQAGRRIRPRDTPTGKRCASPESATRLFERARGKVDVKIGPHEYRAFRRHRSAPGSGFKTFDFAPPGALRYCLIVPA